MLSRLLKRLLKRLKAWLFYDEFSVPAPAPESIPETPRRSSEEITREVKARSRQNEQPAPQRPDLVRPTSSRVPSPPPPPPPPRPRYDPPRRATVREPSFVKFRYQWTTRRIY